MTPLRENTGIKYFTVMITALVIFSSGCGANWFGSSSDNISSLEIYPVTTTIAAGFLHDYRATAIFGNNARKDVTGDAQWESSNPDVAQIAGNGIVRGLGRGSAEIKVSYNGTSRSMRLTVTDADLVSVQVTPIRPTLAPGTHQQFRALGIFSDGTVQDLSGQVRWSSNDSHTATIGNVDAAGGLCEVHNPGMTRISASIAGIRGATLLNSTSAALASIQVTPINPTRARGFTLQFSATGIFSNSVTADLTRQVTWSSSSSSVAKISNDSDSRGYAELAGSGEAVIATSLEGITGQTMLKVSSATLVSIQVTPANSRKPVGLREQFVATGIFSDGSHHNITADVTWSVENPEPQMPVAVISNQKGHEGKATALRPGTVTVKAVKSADGIIYDSATEGSTAFTVK
jgi:hypothetical protein